MTPQRGRTRRYTLTKKTVQLASAVLLVVTWTSQHLGWGISRPFHSLNRANQHVLTPLACDPDCLQL